MIFSEVDEVINIIPIYKNFIDNDNVFDFNDKYIIDNFKINYYEKKVIEKINFVPVVKYLLNKCEHVKGKTNKCFISLIIYKFVFSNIDFLFEHKKFCDTIYNKMLEFKNNDYLIFETFKMFTEQNKNPIDIWFDIYNTEILKQELKDTFKKENLIITTSCTLVDLEEIKTTHSILHLHDDSQNSNNHNIKFIFKSTNEYTIEKFTDVIHTLLNYNNFNVITLLAIYEIIINNINYIKENEEYKKKIIDNINYNIKNNLLLFDNFKKYNYGLNPLITVKKMLDFYLG